MGCGSDKENKVNKKMDQKPGGGPFDKMVGCGKGKRAPSERWVQDGGTRKET